MKQQTMIRPVYVASITAVAGLVLALTVGYRGASDHVQHVMGGVPGPVNCTSCHIYMKKDSWVKGLLEETYLTPVDVAVSGDGSRLYVVAEEADVLLIVAVDESRVVGRVALGRRPHNIVLSQDGQRAYVSNSWSDNVSVIDLAQQHVVAVLETGNGPTGLALGPDEQHLFTANMYSDDISVIDLASGVETKRLRAGNNPYAARLSPDGQLLYVTNRLTNPVPFRAPPQTEVTVVDARTQRVVDRKDVPAAHLLEGVAFTPESDLALVTLVRPKNLIPSTQVGRGWMLTYGLGIIETDGGQPVAQLLLDDVGAYFADPYDVVITPDGRRAFVSHAAADVVSVVDLQALRRVLDGATPDSLALFANHLGISSQYVVARIPTGANPKRLALSPDGRRLYVTERLEDRLAVIDTESLETVRHIDLGGPTDVSTLRLGARMFNGARAFQGQFSCRTCHPDDDQDALPWDFAEPMGLGRNIVNTMTLRDIGETGPFKWAGTNVSLYMQDGIRFAKHLTRVDPYPPRELRALVAYIYDIPQPPNRYLRGQEALTAAQQRGQVLFERTMTNAGQPIPPGNQCLTCHPPPYYTNLQKADVGTLRDTDKEMLFDTPQLINIYDSDPYLHDGSALTLEEIWTKNSVNDEHGFVSDLTKNQLNDLIEYLKALGPPEAQPEQ